MQFIDTHTHLFLPEFDQDRDQVIKNAIDHNVQKMLLPNADSTTINPLMELIQKYPLNCFPMMGVHPTSVRADYEKELDIVESWLEKEKFIAIGEIGMDLYWDKTFQKQQEEVFRRQLNLAKKYNLPVVIHARESFDEIFKIIDEEVDDRLTGVFHAFTGTVEQANQIIEWGFMMGIGGIVTFKNAGLDKVVRNIDINHIVLETDAPYLAPVPKRGKRNQSAYIRHIAEKIALIKEISIEKVANITTDNAKQLFRL
ncbi:MAG: TatD DNase family protein [Bacteroidales bacterium]|jgi:TatD DNase family protein|nr:TatD DNase family protein [Bacteroidales bacterium]